MNATSGSLCPRYLNPWFGVHGDREDQGGDALRGHRKERERASCPGQAAGDTRKRWQRRGGTSGRPGPCGRLTALGPRLTAALISLFHRDYVAGPAAVKTQLRSLSDRY